MLCSQQLSDSSQQQQPGAGGGEWSSSQAGHRLLGPSGDAALACSGCDDFCIVIRTCQQALQSPRLGGPWTPSQSLANGRQRCHAFSLLPIAAMPTDAPSSFAVAQWTVCEHTSALHRHRRRSFKAAAHTKRTHHRFAPQQWRRSPSLTTRLGSTTPRSSPAWSRTPRC